MEQHPEMLAQEGKDRGWGGELEKGKSPHPRRTG